MIGAFDAIVVGAGPAGAMTAARLAERGLSVRLLERAQLPRDKPCGGGLSPKAHRGLEVDVADLVLARPNRVLLRAPRAGPSIVEARSSAIWMIQRPAFDLRLVEHARERGATVSTGAIVRAVQPGGRSDLATVETDRGVERARVVVGADGADSVVARSVGLRPARDRRYFLALEAEGWAPRNSPEKEAIVDFCLPRGYAWLFPKGRLANVGVGSSDRRQFRLLRQRLAEFVKRHGLEYEQLPRIVGHKIPIWTGPEPLVAGNVLLVGDAAGVVEPFFGEGIAFALQSGRFAARSIISHLAGQSPDLNDYTSAIQGVLARDLRFLAVVAAITYRVPSLCVRALAASKFCQHLADVAISGEKSFSGAWRKQS